MKSEKKMLVMAVFFFFFETGMKIANVRRNTYEFNDTLALDVNPILNIRLIGLITLIITYLTYKYRYKTPSLIGTYLIISGAISNSLDRILFGGVIDYIYYPWFVGNFADILILAGLISWLGFDKYAVQLRQRLKVSYHSLEE